MLRAFLCGIPVAGVLTILAMSAADEGTPLNDRRRHLGELFRSLSG